MMIFINVELLYNLVKLGYDLDLNLLLKIVGYQAHEYDEEGNLKSTEFQKFLE